MAEIPWAYRVPARDNRARVQCGKRDRRLIDINDIQGSHLGGCKRSNKIHGTAGHEISIYYFQFMDRGAANLSLLPTRRYIRGRGYNAISAVYPHCTATETAL